MKASILALSIVICNLLQSCEPPQKPTNIGVQTSVKGAYILCEGLLRQDNSTLSRFDEASGTMQNDIVARVNVGLRLGDTANDVVLKGDTLYIAVTTSRTIEVFRASTAEWLGRIRFSESRQEPRSIAILNDTSAFVTLFNDDSIQEFNPTTFSLKGLPIKVGPTPEGITGTGNMVLVANSGFGDFRATETKAGTISVINTQLRREIKILQGLPNVREIFLSPDKGRFYATYTHLYSQKDSIGGIVEYDVETQTERRRWRVKEPISTCLRNDSLFCISARGLEVLPLRETNTGFRVLLAAQARNVWYSLALHPRNGEIWIGNARDYQAEGEVLVMTPFGGITKRFEVGINPNTIVFF